jgi:hypothetical protein
MQMPAIRDTPESSRDGVKYDHDNNAYPPLPQQWHRGGAEANDEVSESTLQKDQSVEEESSQQRSILKWRKSLPPETYANCCLKRKVADIKSIKRA